MKPGQLICNKEATPSSRQHRKPCSDCPWARTALPGWLGGVSSRDWLADAHGEAIVDCHVFSGPQCAGAAIYRSNVGKLPRSSDALLLPKDRARVFASPVEFIEHHGDEKGKR